LRVCVLTTSFPRFPEGDGACGNFVNNLVLALSEKIEMKVVAPHDHGAKIRDKFNDVCIYRFRYFFPSKLERVAYGEKGIIENLRKNFFLVLQVPFFLFFFLLKTWQVSRDCDLIHANWVITGAIALMVKSLLNIPVVLTVHNTRLRHFPKWLTRYVVGKVDMVISPHPELTEIIRSLGKKRLVEIPNMIDFDKFGLTEGVSQVRKELGIKEEMIVTYVARLVEWKDPLTFVKSIPYVINELENVKFLVIGGGTLENDLRQLIKELHIEKYVVITGQRNDIASILEISNVFAALSMVENIWSMTVVEAMTAGVACILTRVGSTGEVLDHMKNSYLIPPKDERALAEGIVRLLKDEKLRKGLSDCAKELMEKTGIGRENIIVKTLDVYCRLVAGFNHG
jgi:glycosyltransferase involved in cell wall biosynthesis